MGVLVVVWWFLASPPFCSNGVVQEVVSPDGIYKVAVSERHCGATTGVTTYITVERNFDTLLAKEADVLIADGDRMSLETRVRWSGPRTLVISWRGSEQVFLAESKVLGISVGYVER